VRDGHFAKPRSLQGYMSKKYISRIQVGKSKPRKFIHYIFCKSNSSSCSG